MSIPAPFVPVCTEAMKKDTMFIYGQDSKFYEWVTRRKFWACYHINRLIGPQITVQGGHGRCCPGLGLGVPSKVSRKCPLQTVCSKMKFQANTCIQKESTMYSLISSLHSCFDENLASHKHVNQRKVSLQSVLNSTTTFISPIFCTPIFSLHHQLFLFMPWTGDECVGGGDTSGVKSPSISSPPSLCLFIWTSLPKNRCNCFPASELPVGLYGPTRVSLYSVGVCWIVVCVIRESSVHALNARTHGHAHVLYN